MTDHAALGIRSAQTRTRITTLLTHARLVGSTVRVHQALRSTLLVRIADVFGQTGARTGSVLLATNCVRAARIRFARTRVDWRIG